MDSINRVDINKLGLDKPEVVQGTRDVQSTDQVQTSSQRDTIALSGRAMEIDRLAGLVRQSHDERITQIRQMLESGTYRVSSEDVARKLIQRNWK